MRSRLTSALAVLGAVALLLVAGNTAAYAAGGHGFSLGHSNKSKKQTTLTRTRPGPALALVTAPGSAPLAVSSTTKVGNLNADTVDGVDSSQMLNQTLVFERDVSGVTNFAMELPLAPGSYNLGYSALMSGAPTTASFCELWSLNNGTSRFVGVSLFAGAANPGHTGTGVLTKAPGGHITLVCVAGGAFSASGSEAVQVTATPLATVSTSAARMGSTNRTTPGAP